MADAYDRFRASIGPAAPTATVEPPTESGSDIQRRYQQWLQQQEQPAAAGPVTVGGGVGALVGSEPIRAVRHGVVGGASQVLGFAPDLATLVQQGLQRVEGLIPPSEPGLRGIATGGPLPWAPDMAGKWRGVMAPIAGPAPETAAGRIGARAIEEAIVGATTAAGAAGLARQLARLAPGLAGAFETLAQASPKALAAVEGRLGALTGTAAGVSREVSPDNPLMEAVSQIGTALGWGLTKSLLKKLGEMVPAVTRAGMEFNVSRYLYEQIGPEGSLFERNLQQSIDLRDAWRASGRPDVPITTPQATGSPLLGETLGRMGEGTAYQGMVEQRARASEVLLGEVGKEVAGPGSIEASQATSRRALETLGETRAREAAGIGQVHKAALERSIGSAEAAADEARTAVRNATEAMGPVGEGAAHSETILNVVKSKEAAARKSAGKAFDAVDDAPPLRLADLHNTVATELQYAAEQSLRPDSVSGASRRLGEILANMDPNAPASFGTVRRWRSELLDEIRDEYASATPNRTRIRMGERVLGAVNKTLDQAAESSAAYRQAAATYRDYIERYRQGVVAHVLRTGPNGEQTRVAVESVADHFFSSDRMARTRARNFIAAVGDDLTARSALSDFAVGKFLREAADAEGINVRRVRTWLTKHREALAEFPEIRDRLDATIKAVGRSASAEEFQQKVRGLVEKGQLWHGADPTKSHLGDPTKLRGAIEREADALRLFADATPKQAVEQILGAPGERAAMGAEQRMRALVDRIGGDQTAMNGLRKGVYDHLVASIAPASVKDPMARAPLLNPQAFGKYLDQHEGVIRPLWPGSTYGELKKIQQMAEIVMVPSRAVTSPLELNAVDRNVLFSLSTGLSRAWGVARNVVGVPYTVSESAIRGIASTFNQISDQQAKQLVERVLFDPEALHKLWEIGRDAARGEAAAAAAGRRLNTYLTNLGGGPAALSETVPPAPGS